MAGFLPLGVEPIAIIREIWGVQRLGSVLAKGGVVAMVSIDGQPWERVPAAMWEGDQAEEWVKQGAVISPSGEHFPIVLESTVPGYPLSDLVAAYKADQAARSTDRPRAFTRAQPTAAKAVGGRPAKWNWADAARELARLDATGGTKNKTQAELIDHLQGWFIDQTGGSPAVSQLRDEVSKFITTMPD